MNDVLPVFLLLEVLPAWYNTNTARGFLVFSGMAKTPLTVW